MDCGGWVDSAESRRSLGAVGCLFGGSCWLADLGSRPLPWHLRLSRGSPLGRTSKSRPGRRHRGVDVAAR
eukprot:2458729-Alexandrium_andersonii.AAC.1